MSRLGTDSCALILLVETYSDVGQSCDQHTQLTTKSCPVFHISLATYSHTNSGYSAVKHENIWSKWVMARQGSVTPLFWRHAVRRGHGPVQVVLYTIIQDYMTSVTPHLCRWSPAIQTHNSTVLQPESVQPAHSLRCASTVTLTGMPSSIIDY